MNRKTIAAFVCVAAAALLAGCSNGGKIPSSSEKGVGAGPYTEWQPITPPSKAGK